MRHRTRSATLMSTLVALGLAAGAAPAAAQDTLGTVDLFFDAPVYEAGDTVTLSIVGGAGDVPVLFASLGPGPTPVPKIGTLGVTLGPMAIIVFLPPLPANAEGDGELTTSFPTTCDDPALGLTIFTQAVTIDFDSKAPTGISDQVALDVLNGDCGDCPREAVADPTVNGSGSDHAFWLPGIGTDFEMQGGNFAERADGTAYLTGYIARRADPEQAFAVHVEFSDRVSFGDSGYPPPGSPKKELSSSAYLENGGPVDTMTWRYYLTTDGTLNGMKAFAGAVLDVAGTGPAFQVGIGANGKNLNYGASGWLDVTVIEQPTDGDPLEATQGDINIDLGGDCVRCPREAGDHAIALPGIDKDYVLDETSLYVDNQCGWATLTGIATAVDDPTRRWVVDVVLDDKMSPGSPLYPPEGSPKKELAPEMYIDAGGPVNPDSWWYYQSLVGTLTGLDAYEGAVLSLSREGPAFQVGVGANNKDLDFGASGWLDVELVSQPTTGVVLPEQPAKGDINVDLDDCP